MNRAWTVLAATTAFCACSQKYGMTTQSPASSMSLAVTAPSDGVTAELTEEFVIYQDSDVKRIHLVPVIDDSGSMADEQTKLSEGLAALYDTYFASRAVNICTHAISSTRRLGRRVGSLQTERSVECSNPESARNLSDQQFRDRITNLKPSFTNAVNFGISGSGEENLFKALSAFIHNSETWETVNPSQFNPVFSADERVVYVFLTDENNATTDLGATQMITELDSLHASAQGNMSPTYSAASFLVLDGAGKPNITIGAANIFDFTQRLSNRFAQVMSIVGTTNDYIGSVNKMMEATLRSFSYFLLKHPPVSPAVMTVSLWRGGVEVRKLTAGTDFQMTESKITLTSAFLANSQVSDRLRISYSYYSPQGVSK